MHTQFHTTRSVVLGAKVSQQYAMDIGRNSNLTFRRQQEMQLHPPTGLVFRMFRGILGILRDPLRRFPDLLRTFKNQSWGRLAPPAWSENTLETYNTWTANRSKMI